jgi:hypothetical protein
VEQRADEIAVQRSRDPYAHLSGPALMAEYARWAEEHLEELDGVMEEMAGWEAMPSDWPEDEGPWTDADFTPPAR